VLALFLPQDQRYGEYVHVIDVRAVSGGRMLEVVMNAEEEKAIAYLRSY
jgi:hypothetical protein